MRLRGGGQRDSAVEGMAGAVGGAGGAGWRGPALGGVEEARLGGEVVEGAAEGRALVRRDGRPAEVGHLCVVVGVEQDVLGLDVAVDHVVAVEEGERVRNLAHPPRHLRLVELLLLLQQLEELAIRRELRHQVHALLVVEVAVQAEHARVLEPRLDLHLLLQLWSGNRSDELSPRSDFRACARGVWVRSAAAHLLEHVVLLHLPLEDHLERNDGLRPLLAAEVDIPEFAPSEGLADVEVGQRPDRCA